MDSRDKAMRILIWATTVSIVVTTFMLAWYIKAKIDDMGRVQKVQLEGSSDG